MLVDPNDDERANTRRYTEDGINVLALDRHGRGLHRARPERRYPSSRFPTVLFLALVAVTLALVMSR